MRILIAEDEVSIAKALKVMLEKNKYSVDMVHNGNDAVEYITGTSYDTIVLDIMMPGLDGLQVLTEIRQRGITAPVLFLTAKAEVEDRVAGLDAGADDYLAKPFAAKEFLARIRALTRRNDAYAPSLLTLGNTTLDCNSYTLSADGGRVRLNNKEYQLMELFLRYPHQIFSTEHLMDKVWDVDSEADVDLVWTYIGFLRRKMKQLGADIEIQTIRGAGYALEDNIC